MSLCNRHKEVILEVEWERVEEARTVPGRHFCSKEI